MLTNATNNCTKFINKSETIVIEKKCTENHATSYYNEEFWRTRTITGDKDGALNLTIQEIDRYWLIQCYKLEITAQNIIEECGPKGFLLPIEAKFKIGDKEYGDVYFHKDETPEFKFYPVTLDDPFKKNLKKASKNMKKMQEAHERMQILNREALELMIRENPLAVGVSGSAIILIIMISVAICCLIKKDKIKLMEMQMMSNMNNSLSRSATSLNQPSVSINIGTDHPKESQNGSLIYPLEDQSSTFRNQPSAPVPEMMSHDMIEMRHHR